jgi:hypothetical protein
VISRASLCEWRRQVTATECNQQTVTNWLQYAHIDSVLSRWCSRENAAVLTRRILGMVILLCRDDRAMIAELLVLRRSGGAGAGVPVPARERRGYPVRLDLVCSTRKRAGLPGVVANVWGMPRLTCARPPSGIVATWRWGAMRRGGQFLRAGLPIGPLSPGLPRSPAARPSRRCPCRGRSSAATSRSCPAGSC